MKRIGFAYNPTIEDALELRERGIGWCKTRGVDAWAVPAGESDQDPDRLPGQPGPAHDHRDDRAADGLPCPQADSVGEGRGAG